MILLTHGCCVDEWAQCLAPLDFALGPRSVTLLGLFADTVLVNFVSAFVGIILELPGLECANLVPVEFALLEE